MEGYLWKERKYNLKNKKGCPRRRFVVLDLQLNALKFKESSDKPKFHKIVPLDQISDVRTYGDNSFVLAMRHVATAEDPGAQFLFTVEASPSFPVNDRVSPQSRVKRASVPVQSSSDQLITLTAPTKRTTAPGRAQLMPDADFQASENLRNLWVEALQQRVNSINDGLDLCIKSNESIHLRYDILLHSPHGVLGSGMSGDVRLIQRKSDGKRFAMKTVSLSGVNSKKMGNLRREIDILKSLDHPHIVRLHETFIEPKLYCRMVSELCEGGELFHRLNKRNFFHERYAKKLLTVMLKALNYLHLNHIVHRDLKLENWLFRYKENFAPCKNLNTRVTNPNSLNNLTCGCDVCEDADLVLIDFGLSRRYRDEGEVMKKQVGTCYYVAPEVLKGNYSGSECDMWSLGVIAFMLISGRAPYDDSSDEQIANKILNNPLPDIDDPVINKRSLWASVSDNCKDFVKKLLVKDPLKRLTTAEALQHPWILSCEFTECQLTKQLVTQTTKVDNSVLDRLRHFTKYKELKRLAMEVIAFSLDHSEIKDLSDLFEDIDKDNDGYITLDELGATLAKNGSVNKEEVEKIFNALDEEQNGKVHVNEFVAGALEAKYHFEEHHLRTAFARLDSGQKGKISIRSLKGLLGRCATKERVEEIIAQSGFAARNDSCEISFREFMNFMRTDGEDDVKNYRRTSSALVVAEKTLDLSRVQSISSLESDSADSSDEVEKRLKRNTTLKFSKRATEGVKMTGLRMLKPFSRVNRVRVTTMFNFTSVPSSTSHSTAVAAATGVQKMGKDGEPPKHKHKI